MSKTYDCVACGGCCFGSRNYVQVFAHDAERLGPARTAEFVAQPIRMMTPARVGGAAEPERFMKMTADGCCSALRRSEPGQFLCAVYEDRPVLCRALEPGSSSCLEARARRGVDARLGPSSAEG